MKDKGDAFVKYCQCGQSLPDKAQFCPHCGRSVASGSGKLTTCPYCGKKTLKGNFCSHCRAGLPNFGQGCAAPDGPSRFVCPKCGSRHIIIMPVTVSTENVTIKSRGCLAWLGWILLACFTFGLILIIPALTNTKTKGKVRTYTYRQAVCQNCANSWRVD